MITDTAPVQPAPEDPGPLAFKMRSSIERCAHGHAGIYEIAGTDEASAEYLANWRYWCPTCRALTMTMHEAMVALQSASSNGPDGKKPIGFIVQVSLPLSLELGRA